MTNAIKNENFKLWHTVKTDEFCINNSKRYTKAQIEEKEEKSLWGQ